MIQLGVVCKRIGLQHAGETGEVLLSRWPALAYYCRHDQAEIDNLSSKHARRGVAIGRPPCIP